jgi:biotin-(acetyl-CoA carboxylase) ligase
MDKIEITLSIEDAARITGKSKEELLKGENPVQSFTDAISEKFKKIQADAAAQSLRNGLEKREKELANKMGVDTYDNWDDLSNKIASKTVKNEGGNEELQKQIDYLSNQLNEHKKQLKESRNETKAVKAEFESRAMLTEIHQNTRAYIESLNLNLPDDPEKRDKLITRILNVEFAGKNFKKTDGGFSVLDANGNIIQDKELNAITPLQLAESAFRDIFAEKQISQGKTQPPTPNGNGGAYVFTKDQLEPSNYFDLAQKFKNEGNKDALSALTEQYKQQNYE